MQKQNDWKLAIVTANLQPLWDPTDFNVASKIYRLLFFAQIAKCCILSSAVGIADAEQKCQ